MTSVEYASSSASFFSCKQITSELDVSSDVFWESEEMNAAENRKRPREKARQTAAVTPWCWCVSEHPSLENGMKYRLIGIITGPALKKKEENRRFK